MHSHSFQDTELIQVRPRITGTGREWVDDLTLTQCGSEIKG